MVIGLIGEGITDHIVIRHLLEKWFDGNPPMTTELQPQTKSEENEGEDLNKRTDGNWDQVFKYCASKDFREAFSTNPSLYVIIHLDSDVFRTQEVSQKYRFSFNKEDSTPLSTLEIIDKIKQLIIQEIGEAFYKTIQERIIFAIAVDAIECWLLPFYLPKKKAPKEINCLKNLNPALQRKYGFTIHKKEPKYYHTACRALLRDRNFGEKVHWNSSLGVFWDSLSNLPDFEEEDEED